MTLLIANPYQKDLLQPMTTIIWLCYDPVWILLFSPIIPQPKCVLVKSYVNASKKGPPYPKNLLTSGLTGPVCLMSMGMGALYAIYAWREQWFYHGICRVCWNRKCCLIGIITKWFSLNWTFFEFCNTLFYLENIYKLQLATRQKFTNPHFENYRQRVESGHWLEQSKLSRFRLWRRRMG